MIISGIVIVLVLLIAYFWLSKGAFSAFLQFTCLLVAGAIAFAVWEPASMFLLGAAPTSGFFRFLEGLSWTLGLLVPFVVAAALLRVIVDKAVPSNLHQSTAVDYGVGAILGLGSGVLATGILVIGLSYARLPTGFGGYEPVSYTENRAAGGGSLVQDDMLFPPVDRIVGGLYSFLSQGSLATSRPLAEWRPDVHLAGYAVRISPEGGAARNVIRPDDFRVSKQYRVGGPEQPLPVREALSFGAASQAYVDVSGEPVGTGYVQGFVLNFEPGAKEATGDFVFGPGQVQLVAQPTGGGEAVTIFPFSMISQAMAEEADVYGRWRFEGEEIFPASVGGAGTATVAFEFFVPAGHEPSALFVKNVRVALEQQEAPQAYASASERDRAVQGGGIFSGAVSRVTELDRSRTETLSAEELGGTRDGVLRLSNDLGSTFNAQNAGGLNLSSDNQIVGGEHQFFTSALNPGGTDPSLLVRGFDVGSDKVMVQIDVSATSLASMVGPVVRGLDASSTPRLVDESGVAYDAVGYVYEDNDRMSIRFTPGRPIRSLNELASISSARSDQELRLLFAVSRGARLTDYAVGNTAIFTINPPLTATGRR